MNVLSQHVLQEPVAAEQAPPRPAAGLRRRHPQGAREGSVRSATRPSRPSAARSSPSTAATREPERILIADDDDDWRAIIVSSLQVALPERVDRRGRRRRGRARRVREEPVLGRARRPPDAGDGRREADAAAPRRSIARSRTPIIVLTAAGGPREWQRLSAIGADAFLVKPVNADDVELVIRRTLRVAAHDDVQDGPLERLDHDDGDAPELAFQLDDRDHAELAFQLDDGDDAAGHDRHGDNAAVHGDNAPATPPTSSTTTLTSAEDVSAAAPTPTPMAAPPSPRE